MPSTTVARKPARARATPAARTGTKTSTRARAAAAAPPQAAPALPPPPAADKDAKPRKPKLVRDGFTMPKDEYAAIDALKRRAATLARPAKKSELLRAGLKLLAGLDDATLLAALQAVPVIRTGRPKATKK